MGDEDGYKAPIDKSNVERISNGIFAFTMTLLARDIVMPNIDNAEAISQDMILTNILLAIAPKAIDYLAAFAILALFWMCFAQIYYNIRVVDWKLISLNLFCIMLIVFIPFTNTFVTLDNPFISILYECNLLLVGLLYYMQWSYASKDYRLIRKGLTREDIRSLKRKISLIPAISLFAIALTLLDVDYSQFLYLLGFAFLIYLNTKTASH
jgi:uncharacterized membrane protein